MQLDPRDLEDLVAVRRAGSLSGAAKARGVAVSTVSRRIQMLEASTGLSLLDRRANGSTLTPHGEQIAELADPVSRQMDRIQRAVDTLRAGGARLPVRITATEFVIAEVLAPALPKLWAMGADFPVHLQSQFDVVSLAGREADVAIRMSRPEGASLYALKLPEVRLALFASRGYLAQRRPTRETLGKERLIAYEETPSTAPERAWIQDWGLQEAVAVRCSSMRAQLQAATAGAGIALLPRTFAQQERTLVELPINVPVQPRTPWLTVHRDLRRLRNVKIVHRWIVQTYREG